MFDGYYTLKFYWFYSLHKQYNLKNHFWKNKVFESSKAFSRTIIKEIVLLFKKNKMSLNIKLLKQTLYVNNMFYYMTLFYFCQLNYINISKEGWQNFKKNIIVIPRDNRSRA